MNLFPENDEKELLTKLQSGDVVAFDKLYAAYSPLITTHLIHLLKSGELAQEVLQDTFVSVWENRKNIDTEKSFNSYLYKIATNKSYDLFRRAAYEKEVRSAMLPKIERGYDHIENYINRKENKRLLDSLLEKMPPKQREVFTLFKIDGYSYEQISKKLNISRNTINTHINRGNQFLKQQLKNNSEFITWLLFTVSGLPLVSG